jgi:uncharacterized LabA/DUF88 family protein
VEHTAETVAIYWDFENLHASLIDQQYGTGTYENSRFRPQEEIVNISTIMEFALSVGPIAINRAFANWVSFNRYRIQLLESAIELIQVFPPGANAKNGADIKLCLDVMDDMMRFPHISTIIVVGGDSDYMPLSYKVKAAGRTLIGIGSERSTNRHWARSCHEFKFYEALLNPTPAAPCPAAEPLPTADPTDDPMPPIEQSEDLQESEGSRELQKSQQSASGANPPLTPAEEEELGELLVIAVSPEARQQAARELVTKAITRLSQTRGEKWIQKARLRPFIQRMDPTFNEASFGFRSFIEMVASMSDLVESRKGKFDHELRLRDSATSPDQ